MTRVLLITQGTGGDIYPFMRIGGELRARGHDVCVLVNRAFLEFVGRAGFECAALDKVGEFEEWIVERRLMDTPATRQLHLKQRIIHIFEAIKASYKSRETILVGNSGSHLAIALTAEVLGTPYLPLYTAPFFMLQKAAEFAQQYRENSAALNRLRAEFGLWPVYDWQRWLRSARRSIAIWPEWFAGPEANWPTGVEPVGFVWDDRVERGALPAEVEEMLSEMDAPPFLLTHGTSKPENKEFFARAIEACESLGRRALVVTRHEELVAGHTSDAVRWYPYLPFASLMPRTAGVIHHGGIGTSGQTLAAGVPHLVLAANSDRPDNAARLRRLGVAEWLPESGWQPEAIAAALQRLASSTVVRERCLDFARRLSNVDAARAACQVIESYVEEPVA